jgi:Glycosyl hydrolase family 26
MRWRWIAVALALLVGIVAVSALPAGRLPRVSAAEPPLSAHVVFGSSAPDLPAGRQDLPALESELGTHLGLVSTFVDWSYVIGGPNETWMSDGGRRKALLAWEPNGIRFSDVANGAQDAYLQKVADSMRAFPYDVYVRPWPEMNALWSSWQPTAAGEKPDGGTPPQFVAAWRHTVDFIRSRGATHLKFVFAPDASNFTSNTPIASIWPGADYVDVLGIDGYNWGNSATGAIDTGDRWASFSDIFGTMYAILAGLHPTAPVWITEFGSKEPAKEDDWLFPKESSPIDPTHDKGAWLNDTFTSTNFPRIQALAYFHKQKERDWRLDSSASSLNSMRRMLAGMNSPTPTPTPTPSSTPAQLTAIAQNAGLEQDPNGDGVPDCYTRGGYGKNTASWSWDSSPHGGTHAVRVSVSAYSSGDRKLVTAQGATGCSPPVSPGRQHKVSVWYRSSVPTNFVLYYRDAAGSWQYWTSGPDVTASTKWALGSWTTPSVPSGASAVSFGLALSQIGSLVTDDYGFAPQ